MTTEEDTVINAEYTEKRKEPKPSALSRFSAYIKKNQAAEAARQKRTGEPSFTEELSKFGSDWGKGLTQGMANVGREEEAKLEGRSGGTKKVVQDEDDYANDILFGSSGKKKPSSTANGGVRSADSIYSEKQFIDKLCEFLRYAEEDDDVSLWQLKTAAGKKQFYKTDHILLSKLLSHYMGHKVTLKDRDLSIK
jgi:hypothetical protein